MATQKNFKTKVTASKSKTSKVANAKKPASKSPSKAKPAPGKAKPVAKAKNSKGKQAAKVAKPKPAAKPAAKPVVKKQVKKSVPVKKTVSVSKAKQAPTKAKAASKPKTAVTAKPVKTIQKVQAKPAVAPKKNITSAPVKPATKKPAVVVKATTPVKTEVKAKATESHKPQPKELTEKGISQTQTKAAVKSTGSKASDLAARPSVSSKDTAVRPKEEPKPKEQPFKPSKPFTVPSGKSIEKMSEKKEHKPVTATASAEEPQKTRYNDKELEEFDQLIDQKLIVAREQLEFYLKQLEDMAENPDNKIKGLDDGLSSLESERISSMASRQQKLIQHLENAKIRIKNKVYGICRETGKLISKERLRAVPHATLSIEAKQAQN